MNNCLKHWKEAATLILIAGSRSRVGSLSRETPAVASELGSIRSGSGLPNRSAFDYDVLLLKRSKKSGFMPSAYVFPGGLVDPSDFSSEWLDVFASVGKCPNFGLRKVEQPAASRPPIFATDRLKLGSPIPGEVAFRICALRETFEESGVLLVVSKQKGGSFPGTQDPSQPPVSKANLLDSSDLTKWRTLVNQNPSNFIQMCKELEVLPNIWALHEWGNWLTPADKYGGSRFDAAFFICCLQETPETLQDQREIVRYEWSTPTDVLQRYQAEELWLPLPQLYELSRLCRYPLLNDLHAFAGRRGTKGLGRWQPVVCVKDNRFLALLPGDRLYPLDTSVNTEVDTSKDPRPEEDDSDLHRVLAFGTYNMVLQVTVEPEYDHVLPVLVPPSPDSQSKL